jgi:hypothetical protein
VTFWDWLSTTWTGFLEYVRMGTSHVLNVIRGALYISVLFKWITLTNEEMVGLLGSVEMILQGIAAKTTVPARRVEEKKQAAFDKGVAEGVLQERTGTGTGSGI